jgi:AcrR family transcriptional regulator
MNQTVQKGPRAARKPARDAASGRGERREPLRTNDPDRTMANILDVAKQEFAEKGLAGARIDEIAAATQTSKRMIYYYFGSKEGLYTAVLEASYREMRTHEAELDLENLEPVPALRRLVEYTFDHHREHEDYIRLVMGENINRGQFLAQSAEIQALNVPAISAIESLYRRGVASGVFRRGLDPLDIHATISALTFFNVSNRHTFGLIFKFDAASPAWIAQRRRSVVETLERFLLAP